MAGSSFGELFRFTTWGESHGPAIGCVVDGVPSRLSLSEADIQIWLDKRKPGQSKFTTQRQEPDSVEILSGVFEGMTTGTPVQLMIRNQDQRSKDYGDIKDKYRPGHADYTYDMKYGIRDHRGGGRSSARETASRVAAGAIARKVLGDGVRIRGYMVQMGKDRIDRARFEDAEIDRNPFFCPDAATAARWEDLLGQVRKAGSSVGAVIEVVASGVPAGLGEPIYDKLDADLAKAMMSINAVKAVEIGAGLEAAGFSGEENADEMRMGNDGPRFSANHAGGILGGISTGQDVIVRFAVKPTSSILTPRRTIDRSGAETEILTKGRHDPCVGIRAVPVGEAMMAVVLADHLLRHRGIYGFRGAGA
ncbi:chorismate synthase [Geminicoccus roseus]|uniref:chorismate synthase n=1 Tax=Geminicoccus roseus TaxID=404900 RepID=UPI0003FE3A75|nr:chorismate synthase [Geminicoccus roseus]